MIMQGFEPVMPFFAMQAMHCHVFAKIWRRTATKWHAAKEIAK
jgi:hypothetical protein